jgi:exodeoxyribonuclease VII small subunit
MPKPKKTKDQSSFSQDRKKTLDEDKLIIQELSYEESLEKLNTLLSKLQNESIHVDDLKISYLQATLYLEHCENLLNTIEQEVVEIEIDESPL